MPDIRNLIMTILLLAAAGFVFVYASRFSSGLVRKAGV